MKTTFENLSLSNIFFYLRKKNDLALIANIKYYDIHADLDLQIQLPVLATLHPMLGSTSTLVFGQSVCLSKRRVVEYYMNQNFHC